MIYIQFSHDDLIYLQTLLDIANNADYPIAVRNYYIAYVQGVTYQRDYKTILRSDSLGNKCYYLVNKFTGKAFQQEGATAPAEEVQ